MPSCMAHYQFGQDILKTLNFPLRQLVTAYKEEFDIGLQGPDIFFPFQMLKNPGLLRYGLQWHYCSANQMFAPLFSQKPKKASAFAYTLGLLCHYFLDSACHPYIMTNSHTLPEHWKMEAAYDKAIMLRGGYGSERHAYLPFEMLDFAGIALIWPRLTARIVENSIQATRTLKKAIDTNSALVFLGKLGKAYSHLSLWNNPSLMTKEQVSHEKALDRFYAQALKDGAEMIETLFHGIGHDQPLYDRFKLNFFGELADE